MCKKWEQEEIDYLEDNWGAVSITGIAKKLDRSIHSIKCKAYKLGLRRHIHSGEYMTYNQLLVALGMGETYVRVKFENNGIPIKYKKSLNKRYKIIYINDFWKWAEKHKNLLNFKDFQDGALGWPEPSWVSTKRQSDKSKAKQIKKTPWTEGEDKQLQWLINQYKYGYSDIARLMGRTEGAIKRRLCDLNIKGRPIKAENHRPWKEWETNLLIDMFNKGYTHEDISERLDNRSVCAVRGKLERLEKEVS